jgi:rubrerythrin
MGLPDVCELVRKHLYCSASLERLVAKALKLCGVKLRSVDRYAQLVLTLIAIESERHAEIFEVLAKELNLSKEYSDCREFVGEPWRAVETMIEELKSGREVDYSKLLEKQRWLEEAVGEETYHKILLPLLPGLANEQCVESRASEALKEILDKIVWDEKYHEKAVKELIQRLSKRA